ncbi:MAG: sulfonate transport system permease protein, partial [Acidimicrobiaceae bacterium]|nr:sulfonate transport system permease protein [Acidimicrobiaceae bacterium]
MALVEAADASVLEGLDVLETATDVGPSRRARLWSAAWPKLAALFLVIAGWQAVVWTGWREQYLLPAPGTVLRELRSMTSQAVFWKAVGITLRRAAVGYAAAAVLGSIVGLAVARVRVLRVAVGSLITGLQTMPSIAWFPLAILLFQLSESAILFVVVLGAAPSIANGIIAGVDHVPPLLIRAGRVVGAHGASLYRHVVLPAALPSVLAGHKQGWAFAWRSLMAGELLVIVANRPSIGARLQFSRELSDAPALLAYMIVILAIGIAVDAA